MGGTRQPPAISSVQDGLQSLKTLVVMYPYHEGAALVKCETISAAQTCVALVTIHMPLGLECLV